MPRLALVTALGLIAACDQAGKPAAPPTPAPTPAAPAVPIDAPPPPVAYRGAAGPAYLGVRGAGLFRLRDGQLERLLAHEFPLHQIVVAADGAVFATAIGGAWKLQAGRVQHLDDDDHRSLERIALGPDGVLWATDRRGVARWDGTWSDEPAETFGGELINDLAVDRAGHVWVMQSDALWRLDDDHWSRVDTSFAGPQPFFSAIAIHPDGAVYVAGLPGTFAFRDGRWAQTGLAGRYGSLDELAVSPAGHVAGSGGVGTVAVQAPAGAVRTIELGDGPARAHRGDVLAVDGGGRTWISTDNGLVILDRDGALAQQWLPGTVAGVTGKITALAVVADGPSLPPLSAAATGAITGKVLRAGKPVAGAALELCDQPLTIFTRTPCEASTASFTATTGSDGGFRMPAVPVGTYGFAVKPGAQWIILIGGDCCTGLTAGGTFDIGAITVE